MSVPSFSFSLNEGNLLCRHVVELWETDFYTPPVLGDAANFDFSAPAVYKFQGP